MKEKKEIKLLDTGMRNPMVFERIPVNEKDRKSIIKVGKNANKRD